MSSSSSFVPATATDNATSNSDNMSKMAARGCPESGTPLPSSHLSNRRVLDLETPSDSPHQSTQANFSGAQSLNLPSDDDDDEIILVQSSLLSNPSQQQAPNTSNTTHLHTQRSMTTNCYSTSESALNTEESKEEESDEESDDEIVCVSSTPAKSDTFAASNTPTSNNTATTTTTTATTTTTTSSTNAIPTLGNTTASFTTPASAALHTRTQETPMRKRSRSAMEESHAFSSEGLLSGGARPSSSTARPSQSTTTSSSRTSTHGLSSEELRRMVFHAFAPSFGGRSNGTTTSSEPVTASCSHSSHSRPVVSSTPSSSASRTLESAEPPKKKSKISGEVRQRLFKNRPNKRDMDRIERGLQQKIFLLHHNPVSSTKHEFHCTGSTGNVYTVTISHINSCSCPDYLKRRDLCKHIFFVLLKVLKIPRRKYTWYQRALLSEELEEIIAEAPMASSIVLASEKAREVWGDLLNKNDDSKQQVERRPLEGDCPICCELFTEAQASKIDWCRCCGYNIHKECYTQWVCYGQGQSGCIYCRAKNLGKPEIRETGMVNEGYRNLSNYTQQNLRRDTTSYNDFSMRNIYGSARRRYW